MVSVAPVFTVSSMGGEAGAAAPKGLMTYAFTQNLSASDKGLRISDPFLWANDPDLRAPHPDLRASDLGLDPGLPRPGLDLPPKLGFPRDLLWPS